MSEPSSHPQRFIQFFGGLRVLEEDRPLARLPTRKAASLLAYLAYFAGIEHPREVLVEILWPNGDLRSGRRSLSVALSAVRHVLEPTGVPPGSALQTDHFTVLLAPDAVATDVGQFRRLLDTARAASREERIRLLSEAVELCRTPFLPGFYEEWVSREQEHLTALLREALVSLRETLAEQRDLDRALAYGQRLVDMDPLSEEAHHGVMRLLVAAGKPAEALRQYQELEGLFRRELGALPSSTVRAMAAGLRKADPPEPPSAAAEPAAGLPTPPAAPPPAVTRGRLPRPWTPFFGREKELAWLRSALEPGHERLVTLTGPGGSGKTRLAIEGAHRLEEVYAGRVVFVPLAHLTDPHSIPQRIVEALGLGPSTGDPLQRTVEALTRAGVPGAAPPLLLVLDNFEHLAAEGADLLVRLLDGAPVLSCLVTSRHRLELQMERELPVPPLAVPSASDSLEALRSSESIRLFIDRAQTLRPDFDVTPQNAPVLQALVERLEGIPLALELAAARAPVLSPSQILAQLEHRFEFLVNRRRDAEARHRSLEAAIDWSYRLLPPDLQRFFAALSVFRGGWTLEAAEFLWKDEGGRMKAEGPNAERPGTRGAGGPNADLHPSSFILHPLEELRSHSLVLAEEAGGEMRYRMLETLREYADARLAPEERAALGRRHMAWCESLLRRVQQRPNWQGDMASLVLLDREYHNLWAALEWCLTEEGDAPAALRVTGAMCVYWDMRGEFRRGREYLARLAAHPDAAAPTAPRGRALLTAGILASAQCDYPDAIPLLEEALSLGRRFQEPWVVALALYRLATTVYKQGDLARAEAMFGESLPVARESGDLRTVAANLTCLGSIAGVRGDFGAARVYFEESLTLSRSMSDRRRVAHALDCLGRVAHSTGDLEQSRACHEEALALRMELGDRPGRVISMGNLALLLLTQHDYAAAEPLLRECLDIALEIGDRTNVANCQNALARAAVERGDLENAADLFRRSLRLRRELGHPAEMLESLEGLAHLAAAASEAARAACLLSATEAVRATLSMTLPPVDARNRDAALAAARARLTPEGYADAVAEGASMGLEQAVAAALEI